MRVLVTGAAGQIGNHLCRRLKADGHYVIAVDHKPAGFLSEVPVDEYHDLDLRQRDHCEHLFQGVERVYHLAANMGGIGFIADEKNHFSICYDSTSINLNMLELARRWKPGRFFFSSSACVYRQDVQGQADGQALRECDAWPADPEPGYGLEKLYTEKLCEYARQSHGLNTVVARFHNVYGSYGAFEGGREKAPAAVCRKIAMAKDGDVIEVWGDGQATRSFLYVDDCVEGILRLTEQNIAYPCNLGSEELISVADLYLLVAKIAGKRIQLKFDLTKPQGVRGRNSDNALLVKSLGWKPTISLEAGMTRLYAWISEQLRLRGDIQ